jgi:20S proteasome alpha/beta subunit
MTLQVGMVGTDGIVIASDTKWVQQNRIPRIQFNTSKFAINQESGIVVAYARNMDTSRQVAMGILQLKEEHWKNPIHAIREIGNDTLVRSGDRNDAHCLIAFSHPAPQLFMLNFGELEGRISAFCDKMYTVAISGDNENSALFWADRYYEATPIKRLIPLAAHLVLMAGKLNGAMISGLEIVVLDSDGIRRVSNESLEELRFKSDQWDSNMREMVLAEQQFTYAPDMIG